MPTPACAGRSQPVRVGADTQLALAGRAMAARCRLDLLVTDLVMPQISGPDLARRIREIHPGVPVLFTSGYSHNVLKQPSRDVRLP